MSNRERVISMLDSVPDYKMGYVLAFIQGLIVDEEADDAFCTKMYQDYMNDPDPHSHEIVPDDEARKMWEPISGDNDQEGGPQNV